MNRSIRFTSLALLFVATALAQAPRDYHTPPAAHYTAKGQPKGSPEASDIFKQYAPAGQVNEPSVATGSRVAHRLIDRTTGKAFSADEIVPSAANIATALGYTPQSGSAKLLERFDRYPAGTVFQHNSATQGGVTSPEVGAIWRFSQCSKVFTVVAATDVFTSTAHQYTDGVPVTVVSSGTLPTDAATGQPLVGTVNGTSQTYFIRDSTTNTFKLAATLGGAALDITTTGTGTHNIGAGPIITSDGGMRFYPGELGYLGTDAGEDIKSISIEMKWDRNVGGANVRNGLTMAFSGDACLNPLGNGISTTTINHSQSNYAYISGQGNYSEGGYGEPIGETVGAGLPWYPVLAGGTLPFGEKVIVTYDFDQDEMRITSSGGKTHRWKHALIQSTGYRHWWVEAFGYSLSYGETPTFYRIWINAPKYDAAPGFGSAQNSSILQKISSGGPVEIPQAQWKFTGGRTDSPMGTLNVPVHVKGTTVTGQYVTGGGLVSDGRIKQGTPFTTDVALGSVGISYGKISTTSASSAGTDQAFTIAGLNTACISGKTVGDVQELILYAALGANGNTKQLKLYDWLGNVRLTLPATTQNGGTVKYRIRQQVLTGTTHDFQCESTLFDSSGIQQSNTFTRTSLNYGQGYFGGNWKSTGATAGDITVFGGTNIYYPCGD